MTHAEKIEALLTMIRSDDVFEDEIEALDMAIKCLKLMPQLVDALEEIALFGIKDITHRQRLCDIIEKAKELSE